MCLVVVRLLFYNILLIAFLQYCLWSSLLSVDGTAPFCSIDDSSFLWVQRAAADSWADRSIKAMRLQKLRKLDHSRGFIWQTACGVWALQTSTVHTLNFSVSGEHTGAFSKVRQTREKRFWSQACGLWCVFCIDETWYQHQQHKNTCYIIGVL